MAFTLPLDEMTTAEKLRVMDDIWTDLQRRPENVPAPAWHADVLRAREQRMEEGQVEIRDWGEAKRQVDERTK